MTFPKMSRIPVFSCTHSHRRLSSPFFPNDPGRCGCAECDTQNAPAAKQDAAIALPMRLASHLRPVERRFLGSYDHLLEEVGKTAVDPVKDRVNS